MDIKPTQDFILVKRNDEETGEQKTESGIILPEQSKDKYDVMKGKVIKAGPGRRKPNGDGIIPTEVEADDDILYKQYAGHHITSGDEDYWLINERDIIATIN